MDSVEIIVVRSYGREVFYSIGSQEEEENGFTAREIDLHSVRVI